MQPTQHTTQLHTTHQHPSLKMISMIAEEISNHASLVRIESESCGSIHRIVVDSATVSHLRLQPIPQEFVGRWLTVRGQKCLVCDRLAFASISSPPAWNCWLEDEGQEDVLERDLRQALEADNNQL